MMAMISIDVEAAVASNCEYYDSGHFNGDYRTLPLISSPSNDQMQ